MILCIICTIRAITISFVPHWLKIKLANIGLDEIGRVSNDVQTDLLLQPVSFADSYLRSPSPSSCSFQM